VIIEHRTFRLADGVDEGAFLEADRRVQQEVVVFHEGFVRRTTARGDDGRWLVETLWYDAACAEAAAGERTEAGRALDTCIDLGTQEVVRWSTLE